MPYLDDFAAYAGSARGERVLKLGAVAIAVGVLIDAAVIHPFVWGNQPTVFYFTVKPVFVGIGLLAGSWYLVRRTEAGEVTALLAGLFVGVVYLQLYYTLFPIPIVDGPAVQIGLLGNLTEGLVVHFGGFAIGALVALVAVRQWGVLD